MKLEDIKLGMHQEQVPRKQGLKPYFAFSITPSGHRHQEQVPRKQGLKQKEYPLIIWEGHASRASSTKTRIETWCPA